MKLVPIVVLADSDTIGMLQPTIDRTVATLNERADMIVELLETRGWTVEMIAWASLLNAVGRGISRAPSCSTSTPRRPASERVAQTRPVAHCCLQPQLGRTFAFTREQSAPYQRKAQR